MSALPCSLSLRACVHRHADRARVGRRSGLVAGLFGDGLFVRLPPEARAELLACEGAGPFEPMPGRRMGEYVVLPAAWRGEPEAARGWVLRSFHWAAGLPSKEKKEKKSRGKGGA